MPEQRNAETVIKFTVDKNASAEAQRIINNVKALLGETSKQTLSLDEAAKKVNRSLAEIARKQALDTLAREAAEAAAAGDDAAESLRRLSQHLSDLGASDSEIDRVTDAMLRYTNQIEAADAALQDMLLDQKAVRAPRGGISSTEALGNTSTTLGAAASVLGAGGNNPLTEVLRFGGDAAGLAEYLPRAADGMKSLRSEIGGVIQAIGVGNIGMIGAIAAVTLVIKLLSDEAAKAKEKADIAIKSLQDYNRLVATGTTESLTEQREAAAQEFAIAQKNFEQSAQVYFGIIDGIREKHGEAGLAIANFNNAIGTGANEFKSAEQAYYNSQKALSEAEAEVKNLDRALQDSAVAANDAAAAQEELAKKTAEAASHRTDIRLNTLLQAYNMDSKTLNDRLEDIQHEIDVRQQLIATGQVHTSQLEEYQNAINDLRLEQMDLLAQVEPIVLATEAENEAKKKAIDVIRNTIGEITGFAGAVFEGGEAFVKMANEIKDASDKLTADLTKLAAARDKAIATANQRLADGLKDLDADLRDQQRKNQSQALKDLRRFNFEERQRVKEHQQALKDIQTSAAMDIEDAASRLDAAGVFRAQQQRDKAIADERQRFENESEQRRFALEELKASIAEQERETVASYQRRHAQLIEANAREIKAAQDRFIEEGNARRQAYLQQAGELQTALANELRLKGMANATIVNGARSMFAQISAYATQARSAASQAQSLASSIGKSFGSILSGIPKFASGGNAPNTFIAGERGPELIRLRTGGAHVTNARDTQRMLGGNNITVNVSGVQDPQRAADIAVQKIQRLVFNS